MNVVHLSWVDINGGAARAAWRVHRSVSLAGVRSSMFVGRRVSQDPEIVQYQPRQTFGPRLRQRFRRRILNGEHVNAFRARPAGLEPFYDDRTPFGPEIGLTAPAADIYHLHQVTGFLDYAALPQLAARAPIVWTLHEMSPYTGGCGYAYECNGYTRQCGACPELRSIEEHDLSREIWERKRAVHERIDPDRVHVVGPSTWIAAEARRSSLLGRYPTSVVPYGLDTDVFRPMEGARRLLDGFGVPPGARVVLFVADHAENPRKGFELLDAALALLRTREAALVSIGRGVPPALRANLPHVHLGALTEDRLIAAMYGLADVFVIPSLQDNLPNTVLEAMACGTPVVGFQVGGVPDMVREGENGLLVPPGNVERLACAIDSLLANEPQRARMRAAARRIAEDEYSYARQGERYLRLYASLVEGSPAAAASLEPRAVKSA